MAGPLSWSHSDATSPFSRVGHAPPLYSGNHAAFGVRWSPATESWPGGLRMGKPDIFHGKWKPVACTQ